MSKEICYLLCNYQRECFSSERYLEFFAIGGEIDNFDEKNFRGNIMGDSRDIIIRLDKGFRPISKEEEKGEGLVRCKYVKPEKEFYRIGISDCWAHKITLFIVPRDDLEFIYSNKIQPVVE